MDNIGQQITSATSLSGKVKKWALRNYVISKNYLPENLPKIAWRSAETTPQAHKITVGFSKSNEGPSVHRKISFFERGHHGPIKSTFRPTKGFCKTTEDPSES